MNSIATKEADIDKISDYELDKKKYTGLSNILATAKGKTYTNTTAEPRRTVLIKSIEQALLPISQRIQEKNEHIKQALDARDLFQSVDLKNNEKYGVSRKYLDTDVSSVYENQRDKYLLRVREEKKQELILAAETDENIQHAIQLLNVYMEESEIVTLEVLRDR
jgi:AraC-like DNA-binding protein